MTVLVGQPTGQNPAYTPADRPFRVSHVRRGPMAAYRRVTVPQFLIAATQALLGWAVVLHLADPSTWRHPPRGVTIGPWPEPSTENAYYGYPIPWVEYKRQRADYP